MFGLSPVELMFIAAVAVLLFGSKLPEVARSLGKSMNEFKKGINDFKSEVSLDDRARTPAKRFTEVDDRDVAVAPKFEPPTSEPTPEAAEAPSLEEQPPREEQPSGDEARPDERAA